MMRKPLITAAFLSVALFSARTWCAPTDPLATQLKTGPVSPDSGFDLLARVNDGNDAISGWSAPLDEYLSKPFDQLDTKGKAIVSGRNLVCMLDETLDSTRAPQSSWTDPNDLGWNRYGWTYSERSVDSLNDEDLMPGLGLDDAFRDLGISSDEGDWHRITIAHEQDSDPDGVEYPKTWSKYENLVNLHDGAVVATSNYGPAWRIRELGLDIPNDKLVPLRQWSDLMYLALQKAIADLRAGSIQNINHVFRHNIMSDDVKEQLTMVTGGADVYDYPGKWPGLSYPITENQALATLSTANGKGIAYLLGTHKSQMGVRVIDRVNIFNCPGLFMGEEAPQWCIYFHITNGPSGAT